MAEWPPGTIRLKRAGDNLLTAILPLDHEFVLEHDEISLAFPIRHELLQPRAECVQQVPSANLNSLIREQPNPPESRYDAYLLSDIGELRNRLNLLHEHLFLRRLGRDGLLRDSRQVRPSTSQSFVFSSKNPIFTSTLMNCGKPWYLSVPRMTVSASGMLYASLNEVESRFG
jgi:hypothetical protein